MIANSRLLWMLAAAGCALAVWNIWLPYSYWLDELYSVTASNGRLARMLEWMLTDVHPPLYNLLLWVWIKVVGEAEPATRLLSLMAALATFGYLAHWTRRFDGLTRAAILALCMTNALFTIHAQEVRSYAFVMLLAAVVVTKFAEYEGERRQFVALLVSGTLLALTHYFGLILTGLICCWLLYVERRNVWRIMALVGAGVVALAWPATQYIVGDLAGGASWIEVGSPLDSLRLAMLAVLPPWQFIVYRYMVEGAVLVGAAVVVGTALAFGVFRRVRAEISAPSVLARLSVLLAVFPIVVATIDLHTPISTQRNYIVLIVPASVVAAVIVVATLRSLRIERVGVVAIALVGAVNLTIAAQSMRERWTPMQNWKAAAAYMIENGSAFQYFVYYNPQLPEEAWLNAVYAYYPSLLSAGAVKPERLAWDSIEAAQSPGHILLGHASPELISDVLERLDERASLFLPTQGLDVGAGVVRVD